MAEPLRISEQGVERERARAGLGVIYLMAICKAREGKGDQRLGEPLQKSGRDLEDSNMRGDLGQEHEGDRTQQNGRTDGTSEAKLQDKAKKCNTGHHQSW